MTQPARIRYSRRGGRINTDFIDNSAGVAMSDREVNLKILLALAIERGRLDPADRDGYLARCADFVAGEVLRQVDHSVSALNRAATGSAQRTRRLRSPHRHASRTPAGSTARMSISLPPMRCGCGGRPAPA